MARDTAPDDESVTNISADEINEFVDEMDAEQEAAEDLCDELEEMEFVTDAEQTLVDDGDDQWREVRFHYQFDNGISKAMPISLVRWANERNLIPRSNYQMPEQDNQWGASFVVAESL